MSSNYPWYAHLLTSPFAVGAVAFAGLLAKQLWTELRDWMPWMGAKLVKRAAHVFDEADLRARFEEEWLAEMKAMPGKLSPLFFAVGVWLRSRRMVRDAARETARTMRAATQAQALRAQRPSVALLEAYDRLMADRRTSRRVRWLLVGLVACTFTIGAASLGLPDLVRSTITDLLRQHVFEPPK